MAAKRAATDRKKTKGAAPEESSAAAGETPAVQPARTPAIPAVSEYVVYARRFRPRSFSDVVGQAAATGALRQALASGRIAQAYLFCGPRGVGKTSLARIVAKALNCLHGKGPGGVAEEPCNECEACAAIQDGRALDVIEMDAATNRGIEEIRSLRENVGIAPAELRYKVYVIDEVHMLTREAWNAFLKTLEEPPPHVKFIFATTDPNNVPETILSRCQRFDLRRIGPADIVARLKQICGLEKVEYEEAALSRIASLARGGLRDAEGLLDQAVNLAQGRVTDAAVRELSGAAPDELITAMLLGCAGGDTAGVLAQAHQALEAGADPEDLLAALIERVRGAMVSQVCGEKTPLLEGQAHLKGAYSELAGRLNTDQCLMLVQLFAAARRQMRDAVQTRLPLEMALIRACRAGDLVDLGRLVSALETPGAPAAPRPPAGPQPPGREGNRPNWPGRPVGTVETRPAATERLQAPGQSTQAAGPSPKAAASAQQPEFWPQAIAAVSRQKGGALLASALSHAQVVRFDDAGGVLTLGFAPSQLFYRDALEKQQNQGALLAVLKDVLGRAVTLAVERVEGTAAPVAQSSGLRPAPARPPPGPPARAEAPESVEEVSGETEIEFDGVGELPLPAAAPTKAESTPGFSEVDAEHAPPQAPVAAVPRVTAAAPPLSAAERKALEGHPLVALVVRGVDGAVVSVSRK